MDDQEEQEFQRNMETVVQDSVQKTDSEQEPVSLVAPAPMDQTLPNFEGNKSVFDYAMSVDIDQRPVVALVMGIKKLMSIGVHQDDVVKYIAASLKHFQEIEGLSERAKLDLDAYLFGESGALKKIQETLATERDLTRQAATGGLLDAAAEVEKLVDRFGNAKLVEFDAHALTKTAELDREMHRITLSSLQSTLASIVSEKASLATDRAQIDADKKFARRLGAAYGLAGLCAGLAIAFGTVLLH